MVENYRFIIGISMLSYFQDKHAVSGFVGQVDVAISGCRSLTSSFVDTVFELAVVENPRFAVGISMLSVIVLAILEFPVLRSRCYFRLSVNLVFILGHFL